MIEQLKQLLRVTSDADLISSQWRNELVRRRYSKRIGGYNYITENGVRYLMLTGNLKP